MACSSSHCATLMSCNACALRCSQAVAKFKEQFMRMLTVGRRRSAVTRRKAKLSHVLPDMNTLSKIVGVVAREVCVRAGPNDLGVR